MRKDGRWVNGIPQETFLLSKDFYHYEEESENQQGIKHRLYVNLPSQ